MRRNESWMNQVTKQIHNRLRWIKLDESPEYKGKMIGILRNVSSNELPDTNCHYK